MGEYVWLAPLIAFLVAAIGWLFRELHFRREARRQAAGDASMALSDKGKLLQEMISKSEDANEKKTLTAQLDEVNHALLGLYTQRLKQTLKDADLPTEEALIAGGRSRLQPQEATRLKGLIEELKTLPPFVSIQDLLVLGSAYYYMQQYEEAKNVYDKILNLNPNDPDTLNNRGAIYSKLGRYDEALADYNRSLELRPDDPNTIYNRGLAYYKLERYDEALADYNRSLELRPAHPPVLNNRGVLYTQLERYDDALADYNRSLELSPDDPDVFFNLTCLFSLWGKTDDALAYLEKAIEVNRKNREDAKTEKDFNNIRDDPRFKKLVGSD